LPLYIPAVQREFVPGNTSICSIAGSSVQPPVAGLERETSQLARTSCSEGSCAEEDLSRPLALLRRALGRRWCEGREGAAVTPGGAQGAHTLRRDRR
jgi:hypothetical protein